MPSAPISVIIPVHNCAAYVAEAIDSALGQTLGPAQIIVVDDGSTDDTLTRLHKYRDRITLIHQPNRGLGAARNTGLRAATQDYIAYLDADDVWHPRKLEVQVSVLERRPDLGMIGTAKVDWPGPFPTSLGGGGVVDVPLNHLLVRNYFVASSVMIRRSVVEQVGAFETNLLGAEDLDYWQRTAEVTGVANIALPLTGYRRVAGSLSRRPEGIECGVRRVIEGLDARGMWAGRSMLRRRAMSQLHYSIGYLYGARGQQARALWRLLKSMAWYPFPYDRCESGALLGRPRRAAVMLMRLLGIMRTEAEVFADGARHMLKKTLLGGACLSIQPLILNALSLPVTAYIIRGLGPSGYGQWTMAAALVASVGVLTNLGLRGAFVRQLAAEPAAAADALAEQLGLRLTLAAISTAAVILLCATLQYSRVVLLCAAVAAAAMIISTFVSTLIDVLQSQQRMATVAAINLVGGLVLTMVSVVVVALGMGPIAVATAYLAGPAVSAVLIGLLVRRSMVIRIHAGPRAMIARLAHSRAFTAQQLLNAAPQCAEALLLPRMIGAAQFGFYTAGTLLPLRLAVVPDGLCTAAYPLLTEQFERRAAGATRLAMRHLRIVVGLSVAMAIGIALVASPIARILFPHNPATCRAVILLTIWALPLFAIETCLGYAINAAGAAAAQARAALPAAICNVVLTMLLMSWLGIFGACVAIPLRHGVRIAVLATCFGRCVWRAAGISALGADLALAGR